MSAGIQKVAEAGNGTSVFRRKHLKSDGREVLLYGYSKPDYPSLDGELLASPASSELRWHSLRREWSIYAGGRQNRTYKPSQSDNPLAPSKPDGPATEIPFENFELAVFENRFPSLSAASVLSDDQTPHIDRHPATGRCEVVVYSPESEGSLATLSAERRELLVHAWVDRYQALFDMGCDTVFPFENRGEEVGVTLHHPHGQIYGFSFTPPVQAAAVKSFNEGFDLSDAISNWAEDYGIVTKGGLTAFAPPFARFPYEVWIASDAPRRGPWEYTREEIEAYASLLGDVTQRYDDYFGRPCPYMMSLHAAPASAGRNFHFTTQFYPLLRASDKLKYLASVEQGTGVFTVDILPEQTAKALRDK